MITKKRFFALFAALAIVVTFGCVPVDETELLTTAGDAYFGTYSDVNISITDLFTNLNDGDTSNDPYIIDWRDAADYETAHIKGAVNMSLSDLDDNLDSLPKDQTILNVCYTGQSSSFATAVMNLAAQDETYAGLKAQNLKYGMCSITTDTSVVPGSDTWANQIADDAGYDLEITENTADTQYELPVLDTGEATLGGIIKAQLDSAAEGWTIKAADVYASVDDYFIVNYWPEDQYLDPGHIPGAYQFTPKEDILSDAELNHLPTDKTIVIYCYSGQTSAQLAAYLRMLGYDAKSLKFGMNGFDYASVPSGKYTAPEGDDYLSILEE